MQKPVEGHQGKSKKDGPSPGVDGGVDHLGSDMDAKFTNDPDAKSVAQNRERQNEGDERRPAPESLEIKMGGEQAENEENQRGADSAALGRNLDRNSHQMEDKVLTPISRKRGAEEPVRHRG